MLCHQIIYKLKQLFCLFHLFSRIYTIITLLQAILNGFFHDFPQAVKQAAEYIVAAAVEIYNRMSAELLPTPAKSHYVFNLRDLSKCVQGGVIVSVIRYFS